MFQNPIFWVSCSKCRGPQTQANHIDCLHVGATILALAWLMSFWPSRKQQNVVTSEMRWTNWQKWAYWTKGISCCKWIEWGLRGQQVKFVSIALFSQVIPSLWGSKAKPGDLFASYCLKKGSQLPSSMCTIVKTFWSFSSIGACPFPTCYVWPKSRDTGRV